MINFLIRGQLCIFELLKILCPFGKHAQGEKIKFGSWRQGDRVQVKPPVVAGNCEANGFLGSGGFRLRAGSSVVPWHPSFRML